MGSFNTGCSISGVSIGCDDSVVLIPLIPKKTMDGEISAIPSVSMFLYTNDLYQPFTLPIVGKMSDCGRLTDIQKNANTEYLANLFGISIESFVECISNDRDLFDSMNPIVKVFSLNILKGFDKKVMARIGFIELEDNNDVKSFYSSEHNCKIEIQPQYESSGFCYTANLSVFFKNTENEYECVLADESLWDFSYRGASQIQNIFWREFKIALGNDEKTLEKAFYLNSACSMFVHKDIFDKLTSFDENLISVSKIQDQVLMKSNQFKNAEINFDEIPEANLEAFKDLLLSSVCHDLYHKIGLQEFDELHKVYKLDVFDNDEIFKAMIMFSNFKYAIMSCCKFFSPAGRGPQEGDYVTTKKLLEESLKIVNNKISSR